MLTPCNIATADCDTRNRLWPADPRAWLSAAELDELARLRHPLRRSEWLGGRWLLKGMLLEAFGGKGFDRQPEDSRGIEILSRDAMGRSQAPRVIQGGRAPPVHVSIAHVDGIVWAAVSRDSTVRVGIDVLPARPFAERLQALWFTPDERVWARKAGGGLRGAALWSAKEAVYKATNCGEPFDPARCEIHPGDGGRWSWTVRGVPSNFTDAVNVREIGGVFVALAAVLTRAPGDVAGALHACGCRQPDARAHVQHNFNTPAGLPQ